MATEVQENEVPETPPVVAKERNAWLPLIVAIILTPLISFGITQFVMIPKLKASLHQTGNQAAVPGKPGASQGGGEKKNAPSFDYAFDNIVVNLAGTKGTRYLKVSFSVISSNPMLKEIIAAHRVELLDLTLNILSSKTLADLEESGAKNILRHDLLENFNQALKNEVVDQLYFSEFVVQ